jgi:hypothetical protein
MDYSTPRHVRLLLWALVFMAIALINVSIFASTGKAYHVFVAGLALVMAIGWAIWSEVVRGRKGQR